MGIKEEDKGLVIGLLVLVAIFALTALFTSMDRIVTQDRLDAIRNDAIEMGYAHYNPKSGVWEFLPPQQIKEK